MHDYSALAAVLMEIEAELCRLNQWQNLMPPAQALASIEPFCVDTLSFAQWVQFIFIPKLGQLIAQQAPLPIKSEISPMVEEYCKVENLEGGELLKFFQQLDKLLTI